MPVIFFQTSETLWEVFSNIFYKGTDTKLKTIKMVWQNEMNRIQFLRFSDIITITLQIKVSFT